MEKVKLKAPILKKEVIKIFKKYGLSQDHAKISANALINAELVGAFGHGISRLKMYCDRISKKVINPKPKIKIKKISQSISLIDADNSIGFVAADIAIKKAISNAKKTGIGLVAVRNSGHYGLSGYYAEQAVKKDMSDLATKLKIDKDVLIAKGKTGQLGKFQDDLNAQMQTKTDLAGKRHPLVEQFLNYDIKNKYSKIVKQIC